MAAGEVVLRRHVGVHNVGILQAVAGGGVSMAGGTRENGPWPPHRAPGTKTGGGGGQQAARRSVVKQSQLIPRGRRGCPRAASELSEDGVGGAQGGTSRGCHRGNVWGVVGAFSPSAAGNQGCGGRVRPPARAPRRGSPAFEQRRTPVQGARFSRVFLPRPRPTPAHDRHHHPLATTTHPCTSRCRGAPARWRHVSRRDAPQSSVSTGGRRKSPQRGSTSLRAAGSHGVAVV